MDKSNNKRRILALIQILRKNSDSQTHLKLDDIISELKAIGIEVNNRKTLYDDFKILNEFNINVEYDNGYYLLDAPFNLSEIKIIIDSINSLKNLDNNFLANLNSKMYSFISNNDEKLLDSISYLTKHRGNKLLMHMEDIIDAIRNNTSIIVKTKTGEKELFPIFLHRNNDYYYFYCHYPDSYKIYHYRFDTVSEIKLTNNKDTITISRKKILDHISESSKAYSIGQSETINIELLNNDSKLIERFLDDFPSAMHTNYGFYLKADLNNVFFSKLAQYGTDIKITDKKISKKYIDYLKTIIKAY